MSRDREAKGKRKAPAADRSKPASPRAAAKTSPIGTGPIARKHGDQEDHGARIEKGSQVRALGGAFEGKTGVVQELDGRGGARVMFGLLTTRVEIVDLVVMSPGKARPMLGSSHRKPQPQS